MRRLLNYAALLFSGLRFRLLLLVMVACAPLIALTLHTAWDDRRRAMTNWRAKAERMTLTSSHEEEKALGDARLMLLAMAQSVPVRTGNARGCETLAQELTNSYPRYVNIGVVTSNAEILASAAPLDGGPSPSEQKFFKQLIQSSGFIVAETLSQDVGAKPLVHVGFPIFDRTGKRGGAV